MSIATGVGKALKLTRQLGIQRASIHMGRTLTKHWSRGAHFRLFLMELQIPESSDLRIEQSGYDFRFLEPEELQAYARDAEYNLCERDFVSMARGSRCLAQFAGDILVGYSWISLTGMVDLGWGLHFNLPDDMAYNFNGYTHPNYRGGGHQGLRHLALLRQVRQEGKSRLFAYVDHLNYRSLQGVQKSGYRRIGRIDGVKRDGKVKFVLDVENSSWSNKVRLGPIQRDDADATGL